MARGTAFWRKLYFELANEVEQVLGKALGYPKYSDDQKNFPGTTDKDGVCVGDHVPESLLSEASGKLKTTPSITWGWDQYYYSFRYSQTHPALFGVYTNLPKSLVLSEKDNVPCTAEIEVKFEKLASYFEKRSKENIKSSDKLEQGWFAKHTFPDLLSSYFHSGKAESYKRAAEKVREILGK